MTDNAAPVPTRSLHRKLAQIMYEAERIPKRGKAPAVMGGFPFVQVGDAADYIRKALAEHQVSMLPSKVEVLDKTEHATKAGGSMTTVDLRVTWTLTDGESGESATIESYGAGADGGDKYSGKATTSAMKYALLAGFLLSTGDDTELADSSDRRPRQTAVPERDGDAPEPIPPAAPKYEEVEELLGKISKAGTVKKGTSEAYKLDFRPSPDDKHSIGFRLEVDGDRAIPQVLCEGDVAEALYVFYDGKGEELVGRRVTVKGRLYGVKATGRSTYTRLRVTDIITPEMTFPAPEVPGQEPMFDPSEQAQIDAAVDAAPTGAVA